MAKAIVSTSVGAEGIDHSDNENILLRDTPDEFADAVVSLMNNEDMRHKIEKGGRELVESKYDWQAVGNKLCKIFEATVEN